MKNPAAVELGRLRAKKIKEQSPDNQYYKDMIAKRWAKAKQGK